MRFRSSCALKGAALGREAENIEELAEQSGISSECTEGLGKERRLGESLGKGPEHHGD